MTNLKEIQSDFKVMKDDLTKMKICLTGVKKDIEYLKISVNDLNKTMQDFIVKADKRFAPRWVADAMKFVIGAVTLVLIGAILALILK